MAIATENFDEMPSETTPHAHERTRAPRILVVDDERHSVQLLERALRRIGDVTSALCGEEALARIDEAAPDLVITDQRMPGMSGSELLARVAEHVPHCARVILTGYSDLETTIRAINEGGVHAYVTKPWMPEHLAQIARDLLGRVELERMNERLVRELGDRNEELEIAMSRLRQANTRLISGGPAAESLAPLRDMISYDVLRESTDLATRMHKLAGEVGSISEDQLKRGIEDAGRSLERMARSASDFVHVLDTVDAGSTTESPEE